MYGASFERETEKNSTTKQIHARKKSASGFSARSLRHPPAKMPRTTAGKNTAHGISPTGTRTRKNQNGCARMEVSASMKRNTCSCII